MEVLYTAVMCFLLGHFFVYGLVKVHTVMLHVFIRLYRPSPEALYIANICVYASAFLWTGAYVAAARYLDHLAAQ